MAESYIEAQGDEQIFRRAPSAATNSMLWLLGGLVALGAAAVGFAVALVAHVNQLALQGMTTVPALLGIGALVSAWMTARTALAVGVGPRGLRIARRSEIASYSWDEIGWAAVGTGTLNPRRQLQIYDPQGKCLAKVSDAIESFDALAETIRHHIDAKTDDTATRIQVAKARRTGVLAGLTGLGLLALACAIAWMTSREIRAKHLLETQAIDGEAQIEDRFLAPNGVTPRLVYRITTADGQTATRNAEVLRDFWDKLADAKTVAVRYVPSEPSISRLAAGEPEDRDPFKEPLVGYGLPVVVGIMGIGLMVGAVLLWLGWDIGTDPETKRFRVKRFGQ